jgi:hypothetical protein
METLFTVIKASILNGEVNCTEPSPSLSVHWLSNSGIYFYPNLIVVSSTGAQPNEPLISTIDRTEDQYTLFKNIRLGLKKMRIFAKVKVEIVIQGPML